MSFFTKPKQKGSKPKGSTKQSRKRKIKEIPEKNDEVTSSEEEIYQGAVEESSEEELETAQEKKIRLAKMYLEEIEREEKKRLQDKEELDEIRNGDIIQKRLKDEYLKQSGKLRLTVAEKYSAADSTNIRTLKCKQHRKAITCICVTHQNDYIFSGSKDGNIIKWSLTDFTKVGHTSFSKRNNCLKSVDAPEHPKAILCITISTDGKFLATGDETNNIQIWDPQTLKHIHTFKGHRASLTGLIFRRETHTLYSCSADKSVKVWSLDEMAYVETMYGHQDRITAIDALYRERAITSGGSDCSIRIWKITEESQLIYNGHSGSIDCVKLINEENFISGGDDGQVCVWSVLKKKPLCSVKNAHGCEEVNSQPFWISAVTALLNTDLIASGSHDGFIRLWKLENNFRSVEPLFTVPVTGFVNSLEFTADGKYLIAATGKEHKFGRWNVMNSAKNCIIVIPLIKNS